MKNEYVSISRLRIHPQLHRLVAETIAPGTGVEPDQVWFGLAELVERFGSENRQLLKRRDDLQARIDAWHRERRGEEWDAEAYEAFLRSIGYLLPEGEDFEVATDNVDEEIASVAGPQLVVPVDNARYALNAANARWCSLYDAFYGTDAIPSDGGCEAGGEYNPKRGERVFRAVSELLDTVAPLEKGGHGDATAYGLDEDGLVIRLGEEETRLQNADAFAGYGGVRADPERILLRRHGLHVELQIDRSHPIGEQHPAGLKDVVIEAAISTIQDCEDSVAAVDAEDKCRVYANWCGLMKGDLKAEFTKGGQTMNRALNPDREYTDLQGKSFTLPGRAMLLVRNVGIHMYTDAVTKESGEPIPEGFLDVLITSLAAMHDLKETGPLRNSRRGSIYIVKPKLHGPDETRFTIRVFEEVERILGLPPRTLKIGIMDEERRTTVNLKACMREAADRVVFINTGFLDRTGDEIHTSMEAGPMLPKPEIKGSAFMQAYEDWNVDVGLEAGLPGHGQIGKGMWAIPDRMKEMLDTKLGHPKAGASCAWVPSPTAAALHAMHYHQVDVRQVQESLAGREKASLTAILTPPLLDRKLSQKEIEREIENNAQSILGYVARWIEHGVGCSKVPDINDVPLMEDRATLRISSQHIACWLHNGLTDREQVERIFRKMAKVVDKQNAKDAEYEPMSMDYEGSVAFKAALDLVFKGREEANGYTESVLHKRRREYKASLEI